MSRQSFDILVIGWRPLQEEVQGSRAIVSIVFASTAYYSKGMHNQIPLSRRDEIEARLAAGQSVMATPLAEEFNVSEDAIRRDLRALAAEGKCRRVYGGALPVLRRSRSTSANDADNGNRRRALAKAAAALVAQGEFVFLDAGSINAALVEYLPRDSSLSVATNSIDIAARVMDRGDLPLIVVGGSVSANNGGCIDASAVDAVNRMNIDRCFLGECAISLEGGMSVGDYAEATFRRALLVQSKVCVIAAMDEMFTGQEAHQIGTFEDIDCIVVEDGIDHRHIDALLSRGVTINKCAASA